MNFDIAIDLDELPRPGAGTLARYKRAGHAHGKRMATVATEIAVNAAATGEPMASGVFGPIIRNHVGAVGHELLKFGYKPGHTKEFLNAACAAFGRRTVAILSKYGHGHG